MDETIAGCTTRLMCLSIKTFVRGFLNVEKGKV